MRGYFEVNTASDFTNALENIGKDFFAKAVNAVGINADLPNETKLIKTLLRTCAAAMGALLLYKLGGTLVAGAVLGTVVSLPATLIAAGTYGTYYGLTTVVAACHSGSLAALGCGVASVLGGLVALEYHDVTIESAFNKSSFGKNLTKIAHSIGLPTKTPLGYAEQQPIPSEWQRATTAFVNQLFVACKAP